MWKNKVCRDQHLNSFFGIHPLYRKPLLLCHHISSVSSWQSLRYIYAHSNTEPKSLYCKLSSYPQHPYTHTHIHAHTHACKQASTHILTRTNIQRHTLTNSQLGIQCVRPVLLCSRHPVGIRAIQQTQREHALMLTELGSLPTTARFTGICRNQVEVRRVFFSSQGMVVKIAVAHLQKVMYHLQSSLVIRST